MNISTEVGISRKAFYDEIRDINLSPLWEALHNLVPSKPNGQCVPELWKWADVAPHIERAGRLITAEEAVRRVLVLENRHYLANTV